jgi:hypothetical protein
VKDDNLFRDEVGQPPTDELPTVRSSRDGRGSLSKLIRTAIVVVALAAAGLVLYGILQIFVCDLREIVFKGTPHRAVWLCR